MVGDATMIQITTSAAAHIRKMLDKRQQGERALRVGVRAGGCSGFEYTFVWETSPRPDDSVIDAPGGGQVFIDPRSLRLLDGIVLDYDTSLLSKGFVISNPHAKSTCGCGTSFSVEAGDGPGSVPDLSPERQA
jgi:iron-sulfur cluster assembly accessory protein